MKNPPGRQGTMGQPRSTTKNSIARPATAKRLFCLSVPYHIRGVTVPADFVSPLGSRHALVDPASCPTPTCDGPTSTARKASIPCALTVREHHPTRATPATRAPDPSRRLWLAMAPVVGLGQLKSR